MRTFKELLFITRLLSWFLDILDTVSIATDINSIRTEMIHKEFLDILSHRKGSLGPTSTVESLERPSTNLGSQTSSKRTQSSQQSSQQSSKQSTVKTRASQSYRSSSPRRSFNSLELWNYNNKGVVSTKNWGLRRYGWLIFLPVKYGLRALS